MANSNGWGDGAANNSIGWGQGANNAIGWGDSQKKSYAGLTDIVGLSTDTDAQAFITAAAITDATQQTAINNLVVGMKADGTWTKMKAIYPFVGGTATTHKYNLKDPRDLDAAFRLVFNGGWTHSSTGATPNGTNGFADTKLVPSGNLTINNQSYSVYSRTNTAAGGKRELSVSSAGEVGILIRYTGDLFYPIIGSGTYPTSPNTDSKGYYIANRTDAINVKGYKNGILVVTSAQAPNLPAIQPVYLSAKNNSGAAIEFSDRQLAFSHISDGLTDTEAANLYTRVQAFQTSLLRQV